MTTKPEEKFLKLYYDGDANGIVALWHLSEKVSLFCEEKGFRKMTKHEVKKILEATYELEKRNIGGQHWVWIFGIQEKSDLPVLPVLPAFTTDSHMGKVVENTGKTGKTGNSVTGLYEDITNNLSQKVTEYCLKWEIEHGVVNSTNLTAFCMWFCEQTGNGNTPGEIKKIAEKIFKITPETKSRITVEVDGEVSEVVVE